MSSVTTAMIEKTIREVLASLRVDQVRPNKLRKLVMKKVEGATWTQFQECLEDMIACKKIKSSTNKDGEMVVLVQNKTGRPNASKNSPVATEDKGNENVQVLEQVMEIPAAVANHLMRKGRRKQINIEQTTKVVLQGLNEIKPTSKEESVRLVILKELSCDHDEQDMKCENQIQAAARLIDNMVESYRRHPERYESKRAGGTFEEQALAKKIRQEGAKRRSAQKHGFHPTKPEGGEKKKRRKFY